MERKTRKKKDYVFECTCGNHISERGFDWDAKKCWDFAKCNICGADIFVRFRTEWVR